MKTNTGEISSLPLDDSINGIKIKENQSCCLTKGDKCNNRKGNNRIEAKEDGILLPGIQ